MAERSRWVIGERMLQGIRGIGVRFFISQTLLFLKSIAQHRRRGQCNVTCDGKVGLRWPRGAGGLD